MVKEFKSVYAKQEKINTKLLIPKWSPQIFLYFCISFFLRYCYSAEKATNLGRFKKMELEKKKRLKVLK